MKICLNLKAYLRKWDNEFVDVCHFCGINNVLMRDFLGGSQQNILIYGHTKENRLLWNISNLIPKPMQVEGIDVISI